MEGVSNNTDTPSINFFTDDKKLSSHCLQIDTRSLGHIHDL